MEMLLATVEGADVVALNSMHAARYVLPSFASRETPLLAVGISASGEVARTIEAMEIARQVGATTLAVTCDPTSQLARTAENVLRLEVPELKSLEPGVPSYTAALIMLAALVHSLSSEGRQRDLELGIRTLTADFQDWANQQVDYAVRAAREAEGAGAVYVGSGPAYGAAGFGAAKLVEITGEAGWRQDVEEWCHLEYFGREQQLPTWLLSSGGRSVSRELELAQAVEAIDHPLLISRWDGDSQLGGGLAEMLSPLVLWVAPLAYAWMRAGILRESVFRGFGGGRSREEGGGASRIRTSTRLGLGEISRES
jgi:glucosamine--fructose-6-phosphate aminotransferase (isomerizing)